MPATPMLTVLEEDKHWWFASRTRAILAYLDRYVGPGRDQRVLDIGCGAANMAHHLAHYGRVVGVDTNPRPLEVARQRGMEAYQAAADALPFEDGEFGLVAMLDTVEHVPAQDAVFEECRRVLRAPGGGAAGGRLLVTVPAFMFLWSQNDVLNMHQRRYSLPELRAKLEQHGFRVLRISYNNFFVFPLAAALILLRRGRAEPALASPHFDEDVYQVEMEPASPLLNTLLTAVGRLEVALLRRVSLPFGTSIIAIAEKV
ncbi:MAG: Sarcosine/dimethylglycine N-methyltransferase [Chloroflexi bacterium ADurb.Bin325]|nr:MAG: Sarcosine/dimethylglycine N-methyltransferase [Chloroflexi bacterium ADurb.Bin325]